MAPVRPVKKTTLLNDIQRTANKFKKSRQVNADHAYAIKLQNIEIDIHINHLEKNNTLTQNQKDAIKIALTKNLIDTKSNDNLCHILENTHSEIQTTYQIIPSDTKTTLHPQDTKNNPIMTVRNIFNTQIQALESNFDILTTTNTDVVTKINTALSNLDNLSTEQMNALRRENTQMGRGQEHHNRVGLILSLLRNDKEKSGGIPLHKALTDGNHLSDHELMGILNYHIETMSDAKDRPACIVQPVMTGDGKALQSTHSSTPINSNKKERHIIPFNTGDAIVDGYAHWMGIIVDTKEQKIICMDSLGSQKDPKYIKQLLQKRTVISNNSEILNYTIIQSNINYQNQARCGLLTEHALTKISRLSDLKSITDQASLNKAILGQARSGEEVADLAMQTNKSEVNNVIQHYINKANEHLKQAETYFTSALC